MINKFARHFSTPSRSSKLAGIFTSVLAVTLFSALIINYIVAAPGITNISPDTGPSTGGTQITIEGGGFVDYIPAAPVSFSAVGCTAYTISQSGLYRLETWGAQGGNANIYQGGRGGYSVGEVRLEAGTIVHVCVGGAGAQASRTSTAPFPGGFNGGGGATRGDNGNGKETASGGGATDIRIGINSLYARAIVAGGGGGGVGANTTPLGVGVTGGIGGGLNGGVNTSGYNPGNGGTQIAGGTNAICVGTGSFGVAGSACNVGLDNMSGGGGGWFGGGSGLPGGGGSGFIFTSASNTDATIVGGTFLLDSSHYLFNAQIIDGGSVMPAPGGGTQTGQGGNGYARITLLTYDVTIGGVGCESVQIISDTQLTCISPPHSAGPADVVVTIDGQSFTSINGYTYTDSLQITGPTQLGSSVSGNYVISLDYNFTGTFILDDGNAGGTFSGADVTSGNQLNFNDTSSSQITYTPPVGFGGTITLTASYPEDYIADASIIIDLRVYADTMSLSCDSSFVIPGEPLNCQITLNGTYAGYIDIQDMMIDNSSLGGTFTSSDPRFLSAYTSFLASHQNTATSDTWVFPFTYISPTWDDIMGNLYDGSNGYTVFWPTLTATAIPVERDFTSIDFFNSFSVGLLAQAYEIISIDAPTVGLGGANSCVGCGSRFAISTFNAPYLGTITLDSSVLVGGNPQQGGFFSRGGGTQTRTIDVEFNGSGIDMNFRYNPDVEGEHTIFGTSNDPAITDANISFMVINSNITVVCVLSYIERGQSSDCTLTYYAAGEENGVDISLADILVSDILPAEIGNGTFVDTSGSTSNPIGTLNGQTFSFCGGAGNTGCSSDETWQRTFTYTLPTNTLDEFTRVRIEGTNAAVTPNDINWAVLTIVPDDMLFDCSAMSPNCRVSRVGQLQDYILRPNGVFTGQIQLTAINDPNGVFSDLGIASWDNNSAEFDFEYTPASVGLKTLRAEVIYSPNSNSGIKVGDYWELEVYVIADQLTINGPDFIARDEIPATPRFSLILNGPYEGDVQFSLWRNDGTTASIVSDAVLAGSLNLTDLGGGVYSCAVTFDMYDQNTSTTTACQADNSASVFDNYNYFEIRATAPNDPFISNITKVVGIIADDYTVTHNNTDATANIIVSTVGTPLNFVVTPNALFAGTYNFDDHGTNGYFVPAGINVTQAQWPTNPNQTLQSRNVAYVPMETGYITLDFNATRTGVAVPVGAEQLETKEVNLLIMANEMIISGPDEITKNIPATFTITLNGPFVGTIQIDEASIDDTNTGNLVPTNCTFDLTNYDPNTNTSTCTFTFVSTDEAYANYAEFFAYSFTTPALTAIKTTNIIADDFEVTPSPELINQRINNPITFTVTPNAMFEGDFTITPSVVTGTLSTSTLTWQYSDYANVGQDPVEKTFTYTPGQSGRIELNISSSLGQETIVIYVYDNESLNIGGSNTIVLGQISDTYTLTIGGSFDGTINLSIWDRITDTEIPGATITTSQSGSSCTFTHADMNTATGLTTCNFTFTLPNTFTGNYVQIRAQDANQTDGIDSDTHDVTVIASDFAIAPTQTIVAINEQVDITITPNALFDGTFNLQRTSGSGTLSTATVTFSSADWPTDQSALTGKTFSFTPTAVGLHTITVANATLGTKTVEIYVLASGDMMSIVGPDSIQKGTTSSDFTLSIAGPYVGTVDISTYLPDGASGQPATGVTTNPTSCTFDLTNYDPNTNATSCTFTVSVPNTLNANWLGITATAPNLTTDPIVAITANNFTLTSSDTSTTIGEPITFTITPNGLFDGTFNLSDGGAGGTFSPTSITFNSADWPASPNQTLPTGLTFTYTPATCGYITITASDTNVDIMRGIGSDHITIGVISDDGSITGDNLVAPGDSGNYTLTIAGPYEGVVNLSLWLPNSSGDTNITETNTFSNGGTCTFSLINYDPNTSTTSCSFEITLPTGLNNINYLEVRAASLPALNISRYYIGVAATDFTVSPTEVLNAIVGNPITFNISPNGLFAGIFNLDDESNGGDFLTGDTVTFYDTDWPTAPSQNRYPRSFQYVPNQEGTTTINVCSTELGCKQITIVATLDAGGGDGGSGGGGNGGGEGGGNGGGEENICTQNPPTDPAPIITGATRIDANTITLFFTPGGDPFDRYLLEYGYVDSDFAFNTWLYEPSLGHANIGELSPNTSYQFRIIPFNDCAAGNASNTFPVDLDGGENNNNQVGGGNVVPDITANENNQSATSAADAAEQEDEEIGEEDEAVFGAGIDDIEVSTGTCNQPRTFRNFLLGMTPFAECCLFSGFFAWLCWPWWLIVLIAIIIICIIVKKMRDKSEAENEEKENNKPRSRQQSWN
jgi:hypothetical protein